MAGVFAQLEKTRLVKKLAHGRERKRAETGKCEGRKPLAETAPEAVTLARRLYRKPRNGVRRRSLRVISKLLEADGYLNSRGKPYGPTSIKNMVA